MCPVKDLKHIIKDRTCLVFIDFEATQLTHEMIQIGAIKVYLKPDLTIKKTFKPYETLVKPKNHVGKIVTELTGLTDYRVKKDGVPYRVALNGLKKYCGRDFERCLFVVYGNSDGTILRSSGEHNMDASMPDTMFIVHHLFDFSSFAYRYIKGEDGNPMSLSRLVALFGIPFDGHAHTALDDARNLMNVYQAFLTDKEKVKHEYMKSLSHYTKGHPVITEVIRKLGKGETVTPEEFEAIVTRSLQ